MIRPMQESDKDTVMTILHVTAMFKQEEINVAEELIDIYLHQSDQNDYDIVIIENSDKYVAGYLCYGPTPLTKGTFDLYWMAVDPKEQGKGYGKKLVKWLEEKVKTNHGRLIVIETSSQPKYKPTRNFYENLNYKETARITDFYTKGDDRVIYVKKFY